MVCFIGFHFYWEKKVWIKVSPPSLAMSQKSGTPAALTEPSNKNLV